MEQWLADILSRFTYPALIGLLSAAGLGVPVSEDLVLLLAGALAGRGVTRFWPTLAAGYLGVVVGDLLIHQWGRKMGPAAYRHPLVQKALSVERQEKVRSHYARHAFWTVVVGRHTPVLRAPVFFLAGASGVSRLRFLAADALSAAITVPIVVRLGYEFGEHLDVVRAKIHHVEWVIAAVLAAGVAAWLLLKRRARRM